MWKSGIEIHSGIKIWKLSSLKHKIDYSKYIEKKNYVSDPKIGTSSLTLKIRTCKLFKYVKLQLISIRLHLIQYLFQSLSINMHYKKSRETPLISLFRIHLKNHISPKNFHPHTIQKLIYQSPEAGLATNQITHRKNDEMNDFPQILIQFPIFLLTQITFFRNTTQVKNRKKN